MMKIRDEKKKVMVALSGGVDSAAAAALLKKQGFEVIGVFFRLFDSAWNSEAQVKKVARKLGIPLKIVDGRKEFQKKIIDYFLLAYKKGLTPNPCVVCNKEIKFKILFDLLQKEKADYVATGHYARLRRKFKVQSSKFKTEEELFYKLLQAKDKSKDQSYFLYRLIQKDLARIIFPLGNYKKSEVIKLARELQLPVSQEESQDICFISGSIDKFLAKSIKLRTGNILNDKGRIIGKHRGLPLYTQGQRRGMEIGPPDSLRDSKRASGTGPYFVLGKNIGKNELIVTNDPKKLLTNKFRVDQIHWINQETKPPMRVQVQIRYQSEKFPAIIRKMKGGGLEVRSRRKMRAVTVGQSAVFYRGEEVLGGGIII